MAYDPGYADYVRELLGGLGFIEIRRMFGAGGVFLGELMIGLVHEDVLYLRAEGAEAQRFEAAGARQFIYATRNGDAALNFWSLPDEAADDAEAAQAWARGSLITAGEKAARRRTKRR